MTTRTKILISTLIVGILGSAAAFGISASFSATTQSSGNEMSAGTVSISNNADGQAMFSVTGASPGDSWTHCIKVTYTGGLPADVRVYLGGTQGPLAAYIGLEIEEGTQASSTFPDCTGFTAVHTLYSGALTDTYHDYDSGIATYPGGVAGPWNTGNSTVYRVTVTLSSSAPNTDQAQSSGILTAFWEAHNE